MILMIDDDDVILLKFAHRIGPGEMKKIIDDACSKPGRDPLEEYHLFVKELKLRVEREKHHKKKVEKTKSRTRFTWKKKWGKNPIITRWKSRIKKDC